MADMTNKPVAANEGLAAQAVKDEEFKQKKREAAKRHKERKEAARKAQIEAAKRFIDELKKANLYDKISDGSKKFLDDIANPKTASRGSGASVFKTLFGDAPKVGARVTLKEAFTKTLRGKTNLDNFVKRWADQGTIVTFKEDKADMLNSAYVIEAIGSSDAE